MTEYRLISELSSDVDVEAAFEWNGTRTNDKGLGSSSSMSFRAAYDRIADGPLKYQELRGGVRRALLKRFPFAVYFAIEADVVVVVAVLHASRDPAEWQRLRG